MTDHPWRIRRTNLLSTAATTCFCLGAIIFPAQAEEVAEKMEEDLLIGNLTINYDLEWATLTSVSTYYSNDGIRQGERILPEGWIEYTTEVTPGTPMGNYGAHFWLNVGKSGNVSERRLPDLPMDAYMASGFSGQLVLIIPSENLVIVRLGHTTDGSWDTNKFAAEVITALNQKK
jgi:hypothetical protein